MSTLQHVNDPNEYVNALRGQDPSEGTWLRGAIDDFWYGVEPYEYECVDNQRIAASTSNAELDAYDEAKTHGCCGFVDVRLGPSPDGTVYRYGFNHGH